MKNHELSFKFHKIDSFIHVRSSTNKKQTEKLECIFGLQFKEIYFVLIDSGR